MKKFSLTLLLISFFTFSAVSQSFKDTLSWQEGYLDIHHLNTARGNATFFVFPDGTTMLFDAGAKKIPFGKKHEYFIQPHDSLPAGTRIAHYIKKVAPADRPPQIDYAVISHFHNDHYGQIDSSSEQSRHGRYQLSGITDVREQLPIKKLIDRGFPTYNYPVNLKTFYKKDATFMNYMEFIREQKTKRGLEVQALKAGSNKQITLQLQPDKFKDFSVRNVKVNAEIWSGSNDAAYNYQFRRPLVNGEDLNENALSLVLKISYGSFDYYTGGDLTGLTKWGDFDVETPVAKAIGRVEAMALNHHGYYDASNDFFLQTLSPQVIVHQVIHDPHYQASVLKRLSAYPFHVFTYNMHDTTREAFPDEVSKLYQSTAGHIMIRVMPGGKQYHVYTLDDKETNLKIIKKFGPYKAF
ncbi:ComEC/Rec2 family competence protein [Dyadobacter alkalitolerans]|uniref:ComEC/Rec2 family competence protein n=1 Tax=Dyadobacter alkalitolerans TaxID=492736 RepID=UPI000417641B|nr:hypothetical protein [Dyadobacter alkalitolerans]